MQLTDANSNGKQVPMWLWVNVYNEDDELIVCCCLTEVVFVVGMKYWSSA